MIISDASDTGSSTHAGLTAGRQNSSVTFYLKSRMMRPRRTPLDGEEMGCARANVSMKRSRVGAGIPLRTSPAVCKFLAYEHQHEGLTDALAQGLQAMLFTVGEENPHLLGRNGEGDSDHAMLHVLHIERSRSRPKPCLLRMSEPASRTRTRTSKRDDAVVESTQQGRP